tara:strand:- start:272 stop:490 length:219 start_codon:yes stop_codon:yes gene_type:complete
MRKIKMSDKVDYTNAPIYSDEQIQGAIENLIDSWDWNDLRQYIIDERMDYYCGNADNDEIDMLMEDYGKKEN